MRLRVHNDWNPFRLFLDLVQTWYKLSKSVVGIGVVERQTTEQQSPLLVELGDH